MQLVARPIPRGRPRSPSLRWVHPERGST